MRPVLFVTAGFIVGFDSEKGSIADGMIELIEDAAIPVCMIGLLYALPNTQLTRRLEKEGRLHPNCYRTCTAGCCGSMHAGLEFRHHAAATGGASRLQAHS